VITKVVHGWSAGGLITYLMGPGRAQEHRHPRVIASWDGRDAAWQPASTGPGEWDLELGPVIRALRAPAVGAGLPERPDESGRRGYVWHCSARVAAADRVLSDGEWAQIARELLDGAGVAPRDDAGGPRWFAIRHADDHIHIGVVLVRQDTCKRFWPYRDYPRLRETARAIERRLGLTLTAAADGTAARAPTRGELEKAARTGRAPARVELLRAVKAAAVAAHGVDTFCAALREAGYLVELRYAPSGDPLGYKVARSGDLTASGEPVYYSGSRLAQDLSLPKLLRRWASAAHGDGPTPVGRGAELRQAHRRLDRARRTLSSAPGQPHGDLVSAVGDVLTALGARARRHPDLGEELERAADLFDRAARPPRGPAVPPTAAGVELRRVARRLIRHPRLRSPDELAGGIALVVAVAALMQEIAAWQRQRGRVHQAAAAAAAARVVTASLPSTWPTVPQAPGSTARAGVKAQLLGDDHGSAAGQPRSGSRSRRG
jgi:hypothetical protein